MSQPADQLRRTLLGSLPAFLLAPAALAQQGLINPQAPQKVASTAKRDIPILPFALAGAFSEDFGGRSFLKMAPELSGSITFSSASGCSFQALYPQKAQPWLVKLSISISAQVKAPTNRAIQVCSAIWSRPHASGAFDPAWNDTKVVDNIAGLMNEFGVGVKLMVNEKTRQCADALQVIAKASPELAKKIGPASNWGAGTSIVLVGTASQDSTQGLISAGRSLQRGPLQAFAEGANCDSFVLPPKLLEAAAVSSKEAALAVKVLVQLFDDEAIEPMGVARIGKLLVPAFNPMPACVPMITFG